VTLSAVPNPIRLTCLVDNAARPHSAFRTEHGLAILVEVGAGRVLFDAAASGDVLFHNLEVLGVDPQTIAAVALSHAHRDHTGGLPALLQRRPGLPVYAHSDILRERFSHRDGQMRSVGLPLSADALRRQADLHLSRAPQEILPGVWTSGEIAHRSEPEGRSNRHFIRQGDAWSADPYTDDQALLLHGESGLVLLCGCCHAGLLNTLFHVREHFGRYPVAVVGGTHLVDADEADVRRVAVALQDMGLTDVYPNHCTGESAYIGMALVLGARVGPFPAGAVLEL